MGALNVTERAERTIELAVQHNLSIFPLYFGVTKAEKDDPNAKKRWLPSGKWGLYQKECASPDKMASWVEGRKEGFGLATGITSNIVVLDIDVKNGKNGWASLKGKEIPETVTVTTRSGGTHFYFRYPVNIDFKFGNATDMYGKDSGVDIRGEGGFAVMPFTPGYTWNEGKGFGEIEIAEMPNWIIEDYLAFKNSKVKASKPNRTPVKPRESTSKAVKPIEEYKTTTNHAKRSKALYSDIELVEQKLLPLLNLEGQQVDGAPFNCIMPKGKADTKPSASLFQANDGEVLYRDWRASAENADYYTLPEVYASLKYKEPKKLNGPELATWSLRLLVDAGILEVKPIQAPELSLELAKKKAVVKTYEGFKYLLAVKKLYDDTQNRTAFSFRFGAAWCGTSSPTLQTAMTQLMAFGFIHLVGKEGRGTRAVNVYQLKSENVDL